jgi:tripartite-type tricarboxylate transporter receptor subunit TctC
VDIQRRRFLRLAAAGAVAPALPRSAMALDYPVRPLRFIVGYTPGGAGDIVSRIIGQWLSERLGQPVIIENKPGAGSNISVQAAFNAPADGYTLLYVATVQAINASLYEALPFNVLRDFTPVAGIAEIPLVMVVNPSVPAKTVAEFIAYAKANPGKISMASFGTGSSSHLAGELFKSVAGVDMTHIPYRGSAPALADVIGGRVEVMFDTLLASLPHIRSGALRGLGLTGKDRSALVPDIPAIGETVPGYRAEAWNGVAVLRGTPPEIVDRLSREIVAGVADPTIRVRLAELATTPRPLGSAEFASFMAQETNKWAKLVKLSGARPE